MSNKKQSTKNLADLGSMIDKTKLKPNTDKQQMEQQPRMSQQQYDDKLSQETEANPPHNPNPFDFVFFAEEPKTYALEELNKKYGDLQSGFIEVQLTALTPVHIVGRQDPVNGRVGKKISKSHFYIQDGQPCIPGSSIRGMLRAFIEAATNGWVSQAQDKDKQGNNVYKPEKGVRHIEFASWEPKEHNHKCLNSPTGVNHTASPAIPLAFKPSLFADKLDIATYLFGYVDSSTDNNKTPPARAGRLIIEDAYFDNSLLLPDYKMVDIEGDAIMGGPRPRANWWHMRSKEVWDRSVQNGRWYVAHIVGDEFWGRKFYYHQDHSRCTSWYKTPGNWPLAQGVTLYDYNIQCLKADNSIGPFRIYFDRVPAQLIQLLCTCLCMPSGSNIKHKLGYGKAFGYGSVDFSLLSSAMLRTEKTEDWPEPLGSITTNTLIKTWTDKTIEHFIHRPSLDKLARILTWDVNDNKSIIFTYPPYNETNFKQVIQRNDYTRNVTTAPLTTNNKKSVSEIEAIEVAKKLWNIKKPVHFQLYQARAKGYANINKRVP